MVTAGDQPEQSAADWVLTTTRSVRKGLDTTREVPRELIEDCLRVAMQDRRLWTVGYAWAGSGRLPGPASIGSDVP